MKGKLFQIVETRDEERARDGERGESGFGFGLSLEMRRD
jgi:hypothetical protein